MCMKNPISFAKKLVRNTYHKALQSIAFYPIFISVIFVVFAGLTLSSENYDFVTAIKKRSSYLFIGDVETARTILSTLIGGILSLTVFSFTMVMVVLGQASSNFSPRLLPGLVSNKKHQLILGWYIGTLLYCTMVLISLGAYELENSTVGLSTTVAAILGVCCVGLFVSFIHNISSAVQIQNIVGSIYKQSQTKLENLLEKEISQEIPLKRLRDEDFKIVTAKKEGYFQGFESDLIKAKLLEDDIQLVVVPYASEHIYVGNPLFKVSRSLTDEQEKALCFACTISKDLHDGQHPLLGQIKLMEVAVRAMSPGVNDPGTALDVLHKLGPLLANMIRLPAYTSTNDSRLGLVLMKTNISTSQLLGTILQPIRLYAKKDSSVIIGLLKTLHYLSGIHGISEEDKIAIVEEQKALKEDVEVNITNKKDKQRIMQILANLG